MFGWGGGVDETWRDGGERGIGAFIDGGVGVLGDGGGGGGDTSM